MANPYTSVSIGGYNSSPPPDDGSQTAANTITWQKHKEKLADPIKTLAESINSGVSSAFSTIVSGGGELTGESAVPSSATADVLGAASYFVEVTGTTTITSLGTGANRIRFVRFADSLTLTHHATSLILPGGSNIATAAGDTMIVVSDASSNARVVSYQRASGMPGMEILSTVSVTAVAAIDFTNFVDDNKYVRYHIEFTGILPATSGAEMWVRMSTDGGSTFLTTSTYSWFRGAGGHSGTEGYGGSNSDTKIQIANSFSSSVPAHGQIRFRGGRWVSWQVDHHSSGPAPLHQYGNGQNSGGSVDALRLQWSTGNFQAAGTIALYGVRK